MAQATFRPATEADWAPIAALLEASRLPTSGAREHLAHFIVGLLDERLVACAGIERYGDHGLLRSVATAADARGRGLGEAIVRHAIDQATRDGLRTLTLLTTTAAAFFPRFGFARIAREAAPVAVQQSVEFREVCCASAAVMLLQLDGPRGSRDPSTDQSTT